MLNDNIRDLLHAVSISDQKRAKSIAKVICAKEMAKPGNEANKRLCKSVVDNINNRPQWMELPAKAKQLLIAEDVENTFDDRLYYFAEDELALEQRILSMANTCQELNSVGIRYRNATLLLGSSGCGKSVFARHLAKKLGRAFYMVDLSQILDSYMGGSAKNLRSIFDAISEIGPNGFVFLDELDAFSRSRDMTDSSAAGQELGRMSVTLMQLLDCMPSETVLMAATNHPETIDPAVLRRFSVKHEVKVFGTEEKTKMLQKYLTAIRENAEGIFEFSWSEAELKAFVEANQTLSNGELITNIQQALADMLQSGGTVLRVWSAQIEQQ